MRVKVLTKMYGEIEVDDSQIIDFPDGILGFDFVKKFVIIDTENQNSPFKWMQAYDEKDLAFVIIRPVDFMKDYDLVISQSDYEAVQASSAEELIVFAIVTIPENPEKMTANLQGPIIINPVKRLGRQAISMSDKYKVRHSILEEIKKQGKKGD
ncbi:MAG TPA: flagellar assembly protein FliW [Spirochaetota bacterium]|nr:flagellar assembly protein FliW [Spirochaetota bacterium]OQA94926.1 MAG: Flagellar assembly factor FliW [Spirochaetes bacterium ADurb.Bin218]HOK02915.1 flagellar assembly protein FliW [Spirochaetota bacterium]HOK93409.1 flagellar assembly protein FliW [Spirochaetota bacterium]HON17491.1 flagellar assembly protein FliW [Spirochaetota bacterium]